MLSYTQFSKMSLLPTFEILGTYFKVAPGATNRKVPPSGLVDNIEKTKNNSHVIKLTSVDLAPTAFSRRD